MSYAILLMITPGIMYNKSFPLRDLPISQARDTPPVNILENE